MPSLDASYPAMVEALTDRYGRTGLPRDPDDLLRSVLAAALDSAKADAILAALDESGLLEPERLAAAGPGEIAGALRSAGLRPGPRTLPPLSRLARWVLDHEETIAEAPTDRLRDDLLALNGIGPATADRILLVGLGRASYPVDRATVRILVRHGWLDPWADYEEARSTVARVAMDDPAALARLSEWFGRVGSEACRATVARCDRCPLRPFLPDGGPLEP